MTDIVLQDCGGCSYLVQPQTERGHAYAETWRISPIVKGSLYLGPSNFLAFLAKADAEGIVVETR